MKEIVKPFEDGYKPTCKIDWEDWGGSFAFDFKTGRDPRLRADASWFTRVGPNKWLADSRKTGKRFFTTNGNKIFGDNVEGELTEDGQINWSTDGFTSRLKRPCVEECNMNMMMMNGVMGRTWKVMDAKRKTFEKFAVTQEGPNRLCLTGTVTMKTCYKVNGNRLINEAEPWITAKVLKNGDLKWSHGYISRLETTPCVPCKVSFDDWDGQEGTLYHSDDPQKKTISTFSIRKAGNQYCWMSDDESFCLDPIGDNIL